MQDICTLDLTKHLPGTRGLGCAYCAMEFEKVDARLDLAYALDTILISYL